MKRFFKKFLRENQTTIFTSSLFRILSYIQILFWPYAFSKILNIISQNPKNWGKASVWAILMILNKVLEDFVRLRSKFVLEKIGAKLKISMAIFFSERTKMQEGRKTGEAVQAIKRASDCVASLADYYKENMLQLPVNFIVVPLVLLKANTDYLFLLILFVVLYLIIDYICVQIYNEKLKIHFKADEVFWGTAYRKAPDAWRQREDEKTFSMQVRKEGKELYDSTVPVLNVDSWRWALLQAFSSASLGAAVLLVLYKIINNSAPVGDLVLVSAYFMEIHATLNIITTSITSFVQTKIALKRLDKTIRIKD